MGYDLTPEQLNALVQFAARRLGVTPQELAKTVQTQGLDGVAARLAPQGGGITDKKAQAEQILQSPQAQALLKKLSDEGTV